MFENNVDLRVPLRFLMRHWLWIVGTAILAALVAVLLTVSQPRMYLVEATIAISPSRTEVQFDNRIQTLADYELLGSTMVLRREALVGLVRSNEIVQAVLAEVGEQLQPEEREISWLREAVEIETAGDLINVELRYADPEVAALILNTWIEHYERHVNQIYGSSGLATNSRIVEQVDEATETYNAAQSALQAFLVVDPVEVLQRELDTKLAVLENYQQARIAAQSRPADRNQEVLYSYYQELAQVEAWLADAEALKEQVAGDSGSATANLGNALALITLRSRAFGGTQWTVATEEGGPVGPVMNSGPDLQVDISSMAGEEVSVGDVDAVVSALQKRREAAQERVDTFLEGLQAGEPAPELAPLNQRIAALSAEVNTLQSQIEAATAEQRELTQARDSAWETYQLLVGREVEEQIASQTTSSEVRIADRAIVPTEPASRGLIRNTALAMVLGALVAAGILLLNAWWSMGEEPAVATEGHDQTPTQPASEAVQQDPLPARGIPESLS